jgi:hypothetical protein
MHETSFPKAPTLTLRFERAGRAGTVRAFYGITHSPAESGFPALKGWGRAIRAGVGFPTIKCEVECDRPGYWNLLGWIQLVGQEFPGRRKRVILVDRFPAFLRHDIPFVAMGYAPSVFDAPAFNSLPSVDWRAALFLCTLPMMSRREEIVPLAGVRWGYGIDREGETPTPYPVRPATDVDWREVRAQLVRRHSKWRFAVHYVVPHVLDHPRRLR